MHSHVAYYVKILIICIASDLIQCDKRQLHLVPSSRKNDESKNQIILNLPDISKEDFIKGQFDYIDKNHGDVSLQLTEHGLFIPGLNLEGESEKKTQQSTSSYDLVDKNDKIKEKPQSSVENSYKDFEENQKRIAELENSLLKTTDTANNIDEKRREREIELKSEALAKIEELAKQNLEDIARLKSDANKEKEKLTSTLTKSNEKPKKDNDKELNSKTDDKTNNSNNADSSSLSNLVESLHLNAVHDNSTGRSSTQTQTISEDNKNLGSAPNPINLHSAPEETLSTDFPSIQNSKDLKPEDRINAQALLPHPKEDNHQNEIKIADAVKELKPASLKTESKPDVQKYEPKDENPMEKPDGPKLEIKPEEPKMEEPKMEPKPDYPTEKIEPKLDYPTEKIEPKPDYPTEKIEPKPDYPTEKIEAKPDAVEIKPEPPPPPPPPPLNDEKKKKKIKILILDDDEPLPNGYHPQVIGHIPPSVPAQPPSAPVQTPSTPVQPPLPQIPHDKDNKMIMRPNFPTQTQIHVENQADFMRPKQDLGKGEPSLSMNSPEFATHISPCSAQIGYQQHIYDSGPAVGIYNCQHSIRQLNENNHASTVQMNDEKSPALSMVPMREEKNYRPEIHYHFHITKENLKDFKPIDQASYTKDQMGNTIDREDYKSSDEVTSRQLPSLNQYLPMFKQVGDNIAYNFRKQFNTNQLSENLPYSNIEMSRGEQRSMDRERDDQRGSSDQETTYQRYLTKRTFKFSKLDNLKNNKKLKRKFTKNNNFSKTVHRKHRNILINIIRKKLQKD